MIIEGPEELSVEDIPELLGLLSGIFELKGKFEPGYAIDFRKTIKPCMLGVLVFYKILEFGHVNSCFKDKGLSVSWSHEMDLAIKKFGFSSLLKVFTGIIYDERTAYHAEVEVDNDFFIAPHPLFRSSDYDDAEPKRKFLTLIARRYKANPKGIDMIYQCLSEILLNFWEHAIHDRQSIIVVHGNNEQIEIACADTGKGVITTLKESNQFEDTRPEILVAEAVRKGVTSKKKTSHMGYGLWFLNQIVTLVGGRLHLYSQGGVYRNDYGKISSEVCANWGGTIIHMVLPLKDPKTLADIPEYQKEQTINTLKINFG